MHRSRRAFLTAGLAGAAGLGAARTGAADAMSIGSAQAPLAGDERLAIRQEPQLRYVNAAHPPIAL